MRIISAAALRIVSVNVMLLSLAYGQGQAACLSSIDPVSGIYVQNSFRYGTTINQAIAMLPPNATLRLDDTSTRSVTLSWTMETVGREWTENTTGRVFSATGVFVLPSDVCQSTPPLDLKVVATVTMLPAPKFTFAWTGFDQPGMYGSKTVMVGGIERTYNCYIPSTYDGAKSYPLFVDLHGGGSYGIGQMSNSRSDRLAEKEGFIVVAPDYLSDVNIVVDLVSAVIEDAALDYNIDKRRVYAIGISQGGNASAKLAYELTGKIAAFGIVSSGRDIYQDYRFRSIPRAMTFVDFHGLTDPLNTDVNPFILVDYFLSQTKCPAETLTTKEWSSTIDDPTQVTRYAYSGGVYGTEVVLYAHTGGHVWPGGRQYAPFGAIGLCTYQIKATEEFWNIVKNHAIPDQVVIDVKPGSSENPINVTSKGVIPVAIMGTKTFDPCTIDGETVRFGPAMAKAVHYALKDVNKDGRIDMVLQFETQEAGIQAGDTSALLTGPSFFGSDVIKAFSHKK